MKLLINYVDDISVVKTDDDDDDDDDVSELMMIMIIIIFLCRWLFMQMMVFLWW